MEKEEFEKLTIEQKLAVTSRGRDLLVSAGAGSGKTHVMTNRICDIVLDDKVPVDDMLIVTFTKKAAAEMQARIREHMKARLRKAAAEGQDVSWIKSQLEALHSANVSTFDSFAKKVVDQFFYLVDIEPGSRIVDDTETIIFKEQALNELFDEEYQKGDSDFIDFLDHYSGPKNDSGAKNMVISLHSKIMALPEPFDTLYEKLAELDPEKGKREETASFNGSLKLFRDLITDAEEHAVNTQDMLKLHRLEKLALDQQLELAQIADSREAFEAKEYDKAVDILRVKALAKLSANPNEKEGYAEIKEDTSRERAAYQDDIKSILALFPSGIEGGFKLAEREYGYAATLVRLVKRMDEIYTELKRDRKVMTYNDIEHFCHEIMKKDEAEAFYHDRFRYIFIDEYQDNSLLQEAIIDDIKGGSELFLVGDIKQSIYRFRLAEPELFKNRYRDYNEHEASGEGGMVIDLSTNFRSRPSVIKEINNIFYPIMGENEMLADLIPGIEECDPERPEPRTYVIDMKAFKEVQDIDDEKLEDITNDKIEAEKVVDIIRDYMSRDELLPDGSRKKHHYRDIVILMRSFKYSADGYREVFKKAGIPLYVQDNSGILNTLEVEVFTSLLSVIDNKYQDREFITLLHSPVFGFSANELAMVRKASADSSYVEAALKASEDDSVDPAFREKLRHVFDKIKEWQAYAVTLPIKDLVWKLLMDTGYYISCGAMENGAQRQANLRELVDRAGDYARYLNDSLYGFIKYIESIKGEKIQIPQPALLSDNDDVVRIMTIHSSKGLEFPVVIIAGMDRGTQSDHFGNVAFDRKLGLGLRITMPDLHLYEESVTYGLIKKKNKEENNEEIKRLFYVAATRAMNELYFVGLAKSADDFFDKLGKEGSRDFFSISEYLPNIEIVDALDLINSDQVSEKPGIFNGDISPDDRDFVEKRLSYEYPYKEAGALRAKATVTGLNNMELDSSYEKKNEVRELDSSFAPSFMKDDEDEQKTLSASEKGTIYHAVLERIDFEKAAGEGEPYVRSLLQDLSEKGIFTKDEIEAVDPGKITGFVSSDLGKRAGSAFSKGKLYREQTFEMKIKASGEDVLVQGIIDCYFEEDDGIVLVDYKSNKIYRDVPLEKEKERMRSQYRKQIDLYREAIQEATGSKVKEAYLYLLDAGEEVEM